MVRSLLWAAIISFTGATTAWSFHEPGASQCGGCHETKASPRRGAGALGANASAHLLKRQSASDVCLDCHASELGAVFAEDMDKPAPERGAGNFIFLLEDNLNDAPGADGPPVWIPGDAAGHNINAPEHGLGADMTLATAPGGSYPSSAMSCISCHDPHGNTNFRLLRGAGAVGKGGYAFANPAPEAVGISISGGSESNSHHTAYRSGMSAWCANCHGDFHIAGVPGVHRHPSGVALGAAIANAYRTYNGSSDMDGGDGATSYLVQVPFEDDDPANTTASTEGPSGSSKVMCLTCHRAHASSAPDAGRWDFGLTYLRDDGQASKSFALENPYDASQRSLCNKCHLKDAQDELAMQP